jgi:hypothetical protein
MDEDGNKKTITKNTKKFFLSRFNILSIKKYYLMDDNRLEKEAIKWGVNKSTPDNTDKTSTIEEIVERKNLNIKYTTSVLTTISSFLLLFVTIFYAWLTFQTLSITKQDFEMSNRPYVSVATMDSENKDGNILYSVQIKNSGKIPAILTETSVKESPETLLSDNKSQTIINPGELVKENLITIAPDGINEKYFIEYTINYKTPSQPGVSHTTWYKYQYDGVPNSKLYIVDSYMN